MTELSPGIVSVADLYREIVGLRSDLIKALTRIEVIDTVNKGAEDIHRDHEIRIRSLESFRWKLAGGCLFAGAFAGGAAGWVALAVSHH